MVIDDTKVRSRVEHEALDDGNRHEESARYRPAGDHGAERSDGRWLPLSYRVRFACSVNVGERKRSAERRTRLNIVRCEQ
jgi:hypothetical protein